MGPVQDSAGRSAIHRDFGQPEQTSNESLSGYQYEQEAFLACRLIAKRHIEPLTSYSAVLVVMSRSVSPLAKRGIAFAMDSRAFICEFEPSWRFGKKIVRDIPRVKQFARST
jgi:hypothetical protein